jgi:hypothetical protein
MLLHSVYMEQIAPDVFLGFVRQALNSCRLGDQKLSLSNDDMVKLWTDSSIGVVRIERTTESVVIEDNDVASDGSDALVTSTHTQSGKQKRRKRGET